MKCIIFLFVIITSIVSYFDDHHQTIVLLPIQDSCSESSLSNCSDLLVVQQLLVLVLAHLDGIGGEDNDDGDGHADDDDDNDDDNNLP